MDSHAIAGYIGLALPNARFIHCMRNPLDACLSCYTKKFQGNAQIFTYSLESLGAHYQLRMEMINHWKEMFPGRVIEVNYEDMVADMEGQTKRLLNFLGMECNNACLDFYKNDKAVLTASMAQVKKPMYDKAVNRWKAYAKHLGPLAESLGEYCPKDFFEDKE